MSQKHHTPYYPSFLRLVLSLTALSLLAGCSSVFHLLPSRKIHAISFETTATHPELKFIYPDSVNSPELAQLRSKYQLDTLMAGKSSEFEKQLALLAWTNSRWEHSGSNTPSASNTFTILEEAQQGKKFRCVEYGIVLKSVLAAYGFPARTLGLKTRDVERTRIGAGHVLTEVWSETYQKWYLLDGQFNIVVVQNGVPLNAVEIQKAIQQQETISFVDGQGEIDKSRRKKYLKFLPHYLYYFDYKFDQRDLPYAQLVKVNGKGVLMLVPQGAAKPTIFQRKHPMDYLHYTNSLADFYRKPNR